AFDRVFFAKRFECYPPGVVLLEQILRILDVRVWNAPTFRKQINVRQRRRRLRSDDARNRRKINRDLVKHQNFVGSDFHMVVELRNDMYTSNSFGNVERLILLLLRDIAQQDALHATKGACRLLLSQRIRLEGNGCKERFVDYVVSQLDLIAGNQDAFPKLKGPTLEWGLISECAENETAIDADVVVVEEVTPALERQVRTVHEVFVEAIILPIDVVDLVAVLAIDHDQDVRQSVRSIGVVNECHAVKLCLRFNFGKVLWTSLGSSDKRHKECKEKQADVDSSDNHFVLFAIKSIKSST